MPISHLDSSQSDGNKALQEFFTAALQRLLEKASLLEMLEEW
jgi:hypothetical protein